MKFFLSVFLILLISCDKNFKAPKPDVLLEEQVMEEILFDIGYLKAAKSKSFKVLNDNNVQADEYIYHKYKIDSTILRQNLNYYATKSFKKAKQIEEKIRLRFVNEKNDLEMRMADSTITLKKKDSFSGIVKINK
jgi:hypothetical protein